MSSVCSPVVRGYGDHVRHGDMCNCCRWHFEQTTRNDDFQSQISNTMAYCCFLSTLTSRNTTAPTLFVDAAAPTICIQIQPINQFSPRQRRRDSSCGRHLVNRAVARAGTKRTQSPLLWSTVAPVKCQV